MRKIGEQWKLSAAEAQIVRSSSDFPEHAAEQTKFLWLIEKLYRRLENETNPNTQNILRNDIRNIVAIARKCRVVQ